MCYVKLLHGQVVQFPPMRAENIFNDITMCICSIMFKVTGRATSRYISTSQVLLKEQYWNDKYEPGEAVSASYSKTIIFCGHLI